MRKEAVMIAGGYAPEARGALNFVCFFSPVRLRSAGETDRVEAAEGRRFSRRPFCRFKTKNSILSA